MIPRMETEMTISETMSVNETIRRYPEAVAVFNEMGVDACCGGAATLAAAAEDAGVTWEALRSALLGAEGGR